MSEHLGPVGRDYSATRDGFYYAKTRDGDVILDLCEKYINKLWPITEDATDIVVKVSEKRHKGSRQIKARVGIDHVLCWSALKIEEDDLDELAGEWLLQRFSFFKDHEVHLIHVSAKPV